LAKISDKMCPSCAMGMCAYCIGVNCKCNDMPLDDISKQVHLKKRTVDAYKRQSEGADLEQ